MTKLGSRKLHICPKVTKMGAIIGLRIGYNAIMGSHFQTQPLELLQLGGKLSDVFGRRQFFIFTVSKRTSVLVL